jgi:hypothetical protein
MKEASFVVMVLGMVASGCMPPPTTTPVVVGIYQEKDGRILVERCNMGPGIAGNVWGAHDCTREPVTQPPTRKASDARFPANWAWGEERPQ